jgi:hypothetical protein
VRPEGLGKLIKIIHLGLLLLWPFIGLLREDDYCRAIGGMNDWQ